MRPSLPFWEKPPPASQSHGPPFPIRFDRSLSVEGTRIRPPFLPPRTSLQLPPEHRGDHHPGRAHWRADGDNKIDPSSWGDAPPNRSGPEWLAAWPKRANTIPLPLLRGEGDSGYRNLAEYDRRARRRARGVWWLSLGWVHSGLRLHAQRPSAAVSPLAPALRRVEARRALTTWAQGLHRTSDNTPLARSSPAGPSCRR